MKIAIRRGHQRTGADGCASGIVNEITVAEDYENRAIAKFKALGHQVLDCTPPEANRSLGDSLSYGINKANVWGADIFISCHVNNAYNSYNGTIGCEVIHHRNSSKGKDYATRVERELANIGFRSRGAKSDVRGLAEINNTNMPCIIIEPFFVEATGDISKYREVGAEGIANAIVKGVSGKLPQNITNKKGVYDMDKIILYFGDMDALSALLISQKYNCPMMRESDFTNAKLKAKEIIKIGGPGGTATGTDRFETFKAAGKLV